MENSIKKRIRTAITILAILSLIGVLSFIYYIMTDQTTFSNTSLVEYDNLFRTDTQNKLQIIATVKIINREAVSTYIYNKKYNITILKFALSQNFSLKSVINEDSSKKYPIIYVNFTSYNGNNEVNANRPVTVLNEHIRFCGDSIKCIVKDDNVCCYYYKYKSLSMSNDNTPYYTIPPRRYEVNNPASCLFKKKGRFLYIIEMSTAEYSVDTRPDLLYSIINK